MCNESNEMLFWRSISALLTIWKYYCDSHRAVNACLTPLYAVEGMHVITVEGIGNSHKGLHPIQVSDTLQICHKYLNVEFGSTNGLYIICLHDSLF